jgi:hypothetical protein
MDGIKKYEKKIFKLEDYDWEKIKAIQLCLNIT